VSHEAQAVIPETNWMFPVNLPQTELPQGFATKLTPAETLYLDDEAVAAHARDWIDEFLAALS
jgi:thiamine transport system substrate-binding protein